MATEKLTLKEFSKEKELLASGHRLCAGCGAPIAVRQIMLAASRWPVVVTCATGCLEIGTCIMPYSAWACGWFHSAFENSAATAAGIEAMYQSLKAQGKIDREIKFIAFGGDGGTYDIGLQALSGALERGHDFLYVCYDNGAYMNTGIQRSSSTPLGASTTTTPAGKVIPGKTQHRKDLTAIALAHNIPFVAQASPHDWKDLALKVRKALTIEGPAFMTVMAPCHRGWRVNDIGATIELARLATDTCFFPLFEVEHGKLTINYKPKDKRPMLDWIESQGRFRHLFGGGHDDILDEIQRRVDQDWERLLKREELGL